MNFGAYTACVPDRPVENAVKLLSELGLDSAEVNSGGLRSPAETLRQAATAMGAPR